MKVYILSEIDDYLDEYERMVGVFASRELVDNYIKDSYSWKDDFYKKFGVQFDDVYKKIYKEDDILTMDMEDWFEKNNINYLTRYFVNEQELIEK